MSEAIGFLVWLGIIGLAIKGFIYLYIIHWAIAIGVLLLASPLLPIAGLVSFVR